MELSADEFSRIVNRLKGMVNPSSEDEHRRAIRVDRQVQITIVPIESSAPGEPIKVRVKNLSSRGIGFIGDARLKMDSQFLVHMARENSAPIELLCTVVHCEQLTNEIFSVGAEFTCVSPADQGSNPAETARISKVMLN